METDKNKFNSLTPEILKENETIYTEALDYAFRNSEIKNIAITGIYGAGKSTVWRTYKEQQIRKGKYKHIFENVISISLGKYEDDSLMERDSEEITENELHNRVERQIINQILSQIKSSNIPLSKYKFKENILKYTLISYVGASISIIFSILLWLIMNPFNQILKESKNIFCNPFFYISILCTGMFFVPIAYFLYIFFQGNRLQLSKLNWKGTEAYLNDAHNDETVLDRDVKEIVYLLYHSESSVIVFEDLDRYENTEIFTKLRELNFLLNSYTITRGSDRVVRFVYMVRDGLFISKNRTKFFDFIVPILPVVDSKTSEDKLVGMFKNVDNAPENEVLADISMYVDDMRLLKNIVNEFIVYSNIIPLEDIELDSNKLFAIITLKNIFPNEFDLLQEDKGFIRTIFNRLEQSRKTVVSNIESEISKLNEKIEFINNRIETDKFEAMALMIPSNVKINGNYNEIWSKFLFDWSKNKDTTYYFNYLYTADNFNYQGFLDTFILTTEEKIEIIEKIPEDKVLEIEKLHDKIITHNNKLKSLEIYSYQDLIKQLTASQIEDLFTLEEQENHISKNHYFPLVRYLIINGLLDETYWYYKGKLEIETSNTLKRNDRVYMMGVKEARELDIFLSVETPKLIIKKLKLSDFNRPSILNQKILKSCLEDGFTEQVLAITDSVDNNEKYKNLVRILNSFEFNLIETYTNILLKNKVNGLIDILDSISESHNPTFQNILIAISSNKNISSEDLTLFSKYIEGAESIIKFIPEEEFDTFLKNVTESEVKFIDLTKYNGNKNRLVDIEKIKAFRLDVNNIMFISRTLLGKVVNYGNLLNNVFKSNILISSREYIESNFIDFVSDYIDKSAADVFFVNDEDILIQILNSEISDAYKIDYLEKNKTILSELRNLNEEKISNNILNPLFKSGTLNFSSGNINLYWNLTKDYSQEFVDYINENAKADNFEDVLIESITTCNVLVNEETISDTAFTVLVRHASESIDNLNTKLSLNRVKTLASNNLISINEDNIQFLLDETYFEVILLMLSVVSINLEDDLISILLNNEIPEDLSYSVINNTSISEENSMKVLETIKDNVLIEKIDSNKVYIIEDILKSELSWKNIEYICSNFTSFNFKDEFIYSLEENGQIGVLDNDYLTDDVLKYMLSSSILSTDNKISLIIIKISNQAPEEKLSGYIALVDEISELSKVWDGRLPSLDSSYQEKIADSLSEYGYVTLRKDRRIQKSNSSA